MSKSKAQGLTLYHFDDYWNLLQVITSKEIDIQKDHWNLVDGRVVLFEENKFPVFSDFESKSINVGEEFEDLDENFSSADKMTTRQLRQFIRRNKEAGLNTLEFEVGFHKRISYAFTGLVLCLMGIPFSVGNRRSGGVGRNIGICISIVFLYWISYSSFLNFGKHGVLPPFLSAWAPNILFFLFAILLLIRSKK